MQENLGHQVFFGTYMLIFLVCRSSMSIQVVTRTDRSFELSTAELEKKLLQNGVKDREIVVISIAGAFRKGKSFMLNFFLKYLNEKVMRLI